jgi:hypothetical protein
MAATVEPLPVPPIPNKHQSCPACGTSVEVDTAEVELARRRVAELESQMELLKEKATAAGMSDDHATTVKSPRGMMLTKSSGSMC